MQRHRFLLSCLSLFHLLLQSHAIQCRPPEGANFLTKPEFWCSLTANITVPTSCKTEVEERIQVPWSIGVVDRYIPKQENQKIINVKAFRVTKEGETPINSFTSQDSTERNTIINLRVVRGETPETIRLTYDVSQGTLVFSTCAKLGDFANVDASDDQTLMLTKWAAGGLSVRELQYVAVRFFLNTDAQLKYADSVVLHPEKFAPVRTENTGDANSQKGKQTWVNIEGVATEVKPAKLVFFFRFLKKGGSVQCPNVRSCGSENLLRQEYAGGKEQYKLIIGVCVGSGLAILLVIVIIWISCCKRSATRRLDEDALNLPASLRHFAYDTGDERQDGKWKQWTEGSPNSGKSTQEFLAIDLSPRNRDQQPPAQPPAQ